MYYVRNSNPAIISQEMFDQAARLRSSRRVEMSDTDARLFSKKMFCGCCGSLCRSKKTNDVWYWVCRRHEEDNVRCDMPPVPEDEITAAFLRLYYNLRHNPEVLSFHMKQMTEVRKRQMLWSPAAVELNREISDILSQSHALALLNRQGLVDPDIFISKSNQLAEQLRNAKQQKKRILQQEDRSILDSTEQLLETIEAGPEVLEAFDEELFYELIDKIIVESNVRIRFRLKNGLELPETIERMVR